MHKVEFRVYYEDTDSGGVVYHSNYFNFTERARTELMRSIGFEQRNLAKVDKLFFVAKEIETKFLKPARLDDIITVRTKITEIKNVSITFFQQIMQSSDVLCEMKVKVSCVKNENDELKPTRIPIIMKETLEKYA